MFFKAVPSFALQSYFEALPILAPCIVCFFLFPSTDRSRCTHRGTHACTCIVQRKTCANMPSMLTSSCPTSVPTLFFSLAFSPHPWDHYSLSSLFFPSLAHSSPSSICPRKSGLHLPPQSSGCHQAGPQAVEGRSWAASVPVWPLPSPAELGSVTAQSHRRCWRAPSGCVLGSGLLLWPTAAILFSETRTCINSGLSSVFSMFSRSIPTKVSPSSSGGCQGGLSHFPLALEGRDFLPESPVPSGLLFLPVWGRIQKG